MTLRNSPYTPTDFGSHAKVCQEGHSIFNFIFFVRHRTLLDFGRLWQTVADFSRLLQGYQSLQCLPNPDQEILRI